MSDQTQDVVSRYSDGAQERQDALCCPVDYDASLLNLLPQEIIEKDYGCGDPSRYVAEGDTVLDLGSGGGKICYMAAQIVGDQGQVIGVDMTDDMLALARRHQADMAEKLGSDRVKFVKGFIQDLALDLEDTEAWLKANPLTDANGLIAFQHHQADQRAQRPLIADSSVDLVISNCVLNLVRESDRAQMIREIFRVLRPGGRIAISDIISDQFVPDSLKADPELWSGCISGAFHEQEILSVFEEAGFLGACFDKWDAAPWQVVEGIEFRSVTVTAVKPGIGSEQDSRTIMYRGPYASIEIDGGHTLLRGQRMEVDADLYQLLMSGPWSEDVIDLSVSLSATAETSAGSCCGPSCC